MRKSLIAVAVIAAGIFGTGYVIGQLAGIAAGFAASPTQSQPGTRVWVTHGPGFFSGPHADGQVTAVNGNTVTIKPDTNRPGELENVTTITLTDSTQYVAKPGASAGKADIKAGVFVIATGTVSSDGKTLTASRVAILPNGLMHGGLFVHMGPGAAGQVTGVSGDTVHITPATTRRGQGTVTTITLTSSTQYFAGPGASATKADIKTGSFVIARGTLSSDGKTLTATQVMVLPSAPTRGGFGLHGDGGLHIDFAPPSFAPSGGSI